MHDIQDLLKAVILVFMLLVFIMSVTFVSAVMGPLLVVGGMIYIAYIIIQDSNGR